VAGIVGKAGITGKAIFAGKGGFMGIDGFASMVGTTGKADVAGSGFTSTVDNRSGKPIGGTAEPALLVETGTTLLGRIVPEPTGPNVVVSASLFASTVWYVGLVKPPGDETTGEGFCSFHNVVAGKVDAGETMFPSGDDIGCRLSDICELVTVSRVKELMFGSNGLGM
jgi:hypothetical protein